MNDGDIRSALKTYLHELHSGEDSTIIVEELGLRHGAARVDLAIVNGHLHGFEIKSDLDTLRRLPRQAKYYGSVLGKATLVTTERYIQPALDLVPQWWGLMCARRSPDGSVNLHTRREPGLNPGISPLQLAKLLWRDEALRTLQGLGEEQRLAKKPRAYLYQCLITKMSLESLQGLVCNVLRTRPNWPAGAPRT